ncbi:MAG: FAD-binding protein [Phycisphaerales bacterium]|nr:FAD-binding protein [Phycisphaerales bacterium]
MGSSATPVPAATLEPLLADLSDRLDGQVRAGMHDRMLYATDASIYQIEPLGVVLPASSGDILETVRFAATHGLPLLPRGAGTSLAGQAVNRALVLDLTAGYDRLVALDPETRTARVQPGLVLETLNHATRTAGLMFGPDVATSSHATIGGMIGNNSAGAHSVLYGRTVDHLLALDVALADGRRLTFSEGAGERDPVVEDLTRRVIDIIDSIAADIDTRFPRTRRRVDGYNLDLLLAQRRASTPGTFDRVNLAHLLCGSEGTLGVTLEATIGLVPTPATKSLAIVGFPDVDAALAAVEPILATDPAAVELLDDVIIQLARGNRDHRVSIELLPPGPPAAVLYVEYFRPDEGARDQALDALTDQFGADAVRRFTTAAEMDRAWRLRKAGEPLLHGRPGARKPVTFIEDTAVDPTQLPEFVRRFRAIVTRHGTTASYYAHASVGCLHIRPLVALTDPADRTRIAEMMAEITDLVVEFGGALSGEHGDGRLRSHLLERFYGPAITDAFRRIKEVFDPEGRMNPGIITTPTPLMADLRVEPARGPVPVPSVSTFFRYEPEHGFAEAVERCNGAGLCRRMEGGTMCPSYRATRDERHATRGRGNALRLAITGQLGRIGTPAWNDAETLATLDLCLSCKACKSECPSNVDIAKLKAEYLAQTYRSAGGPPLAARVFGRVRAASRLAAMAPNLVNPLLRSGPVRFAMNRLLGLEPRRSLPPFARSLYRRPRSDDGDGPAVILFPDCFTVYNEPVIGEDAIAVLRRLGYRVVLPRLGCCGRSMISNGLLEDAVGVVERTARELLDAVETHDAIAVVGCEPSCVSAITDDWLDLSTRLDPVRLHELAAKTQLVEDFLDTRWDRHPNPPPASRTPGASACRVHGHCHHKALGDPAGTVRLLQRVRGGDVSLIDAGCCGMAGAFGYTRAHYDVSMAVGELALFPAVRDEPDAVIAAAGTSCRHQVRDGTGRVARHPISLVAEAWREG